MAAAIGPMLAGCGGDDEQKPPQPARTAPAEAIDEPVTAPPPETTITPEKRDPDTEPRTAPEEEQQGDEEAIRSEAVFTGRDGRLRPREVRVPAFIAIRVILRGDGETYELAIAGRRLTIDDARGTDEAELDGLLPRKSYRGRGPQGNVRIVASAEPGP